MSRLKYERSYRFDLVFAHIIGRTQNIDLAKQLCPNQNSYTRLLTPLNQHILNLELIVTVSEEQMGTLKLMSLC